MTETQKSQLRGLVEGTDFLDILRDGRPSLSSEYIEAGALAGARAEGWEKCIDKILEIVQINVVDVPQSQFIPVDQLYE